MRERDIRNFLNLTAGDMLVVLVLIIFIIASFGFKKKVKGDVIVEVNGKYLYRFPSTADTVISEMGYKGPFKFQIKDGKVRMLDSTCPLHLCVKEGWISRGGDMIICIPNRVKISFGGSKFDAVLK